MQLLLLLFLIYILTLCFRFFSIFVFSARISTLLVCVCVCVCRHALLRYQRVLIMSTLWLLFSGTLYHLCFVTCHVYVVCVFACLVCFLECLVFAFYVFVVVSLVFVYVVFALTYRVCAFSDSCFDWVVNVLFSSRCVLSLMLRCLCWMSVVHTMLVNGGARSFIHDFIWKVPFQFVAILCYMFSIADSKSPESWGAWFKGVKVLGLLI